MYNDQSDYTALLTRLRALDIDALEELYVHARERLFVYAFSIIKEEEAAQDLVQELFIDFWENRVFLQIQTGLIGYLVRSVRNRSLDYLKTEQNRKKLRQEHYRADEGEPIVTDVMEAWELGEEIESAIGKLPPMPAKVFRLHYIEKLNYAEIAEQLQISSNTVSNHMTRALKQLRESLKKT